MLAGPQQLVQVVERWLCVALYDWLFSADSFWLGSKWRKSHLPLGVGLAIQECDNTLANIQTTQNGFFFPFLLLFSLGECIGGNKRVLVCSMELFRHWTGVKINSEVSLTSPLRTLSLKFIDVQALNILTPWTLFQISIQVSRQFPSLKYPSQHICLCVSYSVGMENLQRICLYQ